MRGPDNVILDLVSIALENEENPLALKSLCKILLETLRAELAYGNKVAKSLELLTLAVEFMFKDMVQLRNALDEVTMRENHSEELQEVFSRVAEKEKILAAQEETQTTKH